MLRSWPVLLLSLLFWAGALVYARPAPACGGAFAYRPPANATSVPKLLSDGSEVALMRQGKTTVVSLSMRYRGPAEDFAIIVPVPVVLQREQVRTLSPSVFDRLRTLSGPELVEQWEQDPCDAHDEEADFKEGGTGARGGEEGSIGAPSGAKPVVTVEARFDVDEYEVVILSAADSLGLEAWLGDAGYKLPAGIEPYLRPYVAEGYKFFVAKVNVHKVELAWGRAVLSPLRFVFDDERFALPIRLGLANVDGHQDLTIYILASERYEVTSYGNVFMPTNVQIADGWAERFAEVYELIRDDTFLKNPRAVVTEYARQAPFVAADDRHLLDLGQDVVRIPLDDIVLTRLAARYDASFDKDFIFRKATPVAGGSTSIADADLPLTDTHAAAANNFRARFFIRYPWAGPVTCFGGEPGRWTGEGVRPLRLPNTEAPSLDELIRAGGPARSRRLSALLFAGGNLRWLLPLVVLGLALMVQTRALRRSGVGGWRSLALTLGVSLSPLMLLAVPRMWPTLAYSPLPMLQLSALIVALAWLAVRARRRSRGHGVSLVGCTALALAPLLLGMVAMAAQLYIDVAFLEGIDADTLVAAVAVAEAEAGLGVVTGALASSLLLVVVLASVTTMPVEATQPTVRLGAALWAVGIVLTVTGVLVPFAVVSSESPATNFPQIWPVVALGWILPAVWLSSRRLLNTPLSARERGRRAAWSAGLAACMMALALLAFARARFLQGLEATAAMSIDASQRVKVFDVVLGEQASFIRFAPLAVLSALAVPVMVMAKSGRGKLTFSGVRELGKGAPLVGMVAMLAGTWALTRFELAHLLAPVDRPAFDRFEASGVEPYAVSPERGWRLPDALDGPAFVVTRDGQLLGSSTSTASVEPLSDDTYRAMSASAEDGQDALLLLDERLSIGAATHALDPVLERGHRRFRLLLGRRPPRAPHKGLYTLAYEGPDERVAAPIEWRTELPLDVGHDAPGKRGVVALRLVEEHHVEGVALFGDSRLRLEPNRLTLRVPRPPLGGALEDDMRNAPFDALLRRSGTYGYVITVRDGDTVADISELILSLAQERVERPRLGQGDPASAYRHWEQLHPELRFILTPDKTPFAEPR